MDEHDDPNQSLDPTALVAAAESRIEIAMAQLILTSKGLTNASTAQAVAVAELRAARKAIIELREQLDRLP